MGGNEKKQRTKGNVKPSSSGRSAVLMGGVTGFVGFTGLPEGAYVPVLNVAGAGGGSTDEGADANIPGEMRLTLRKMGKKDSTTKIKALHEFHELCAEAPQEALKAVSPFWPRIFAKLAVDADRRVRENVHKAHGLLASKLGRNLAPQLKELMGVWYTSQCDPHSPAAGEAARSLRACFSNDAKLADAVAFCRVEILGHVHDCLFDNGDVSDEQKERVLVGALAGYSLLLRQHDGAETDAAMEKHRQLWARPEMYRLVSKDVGTGPTKQAWFRAVTSMSQSFPQLVRDNSIKLLPCLLTLLDDDESLTQASMWQSVLAVLTSQEDLSATPHAANLLGGLAPRLAKLLRCGCYGNASSVGPLVLPLIRLIGDRAKPMPLMAALRQGLADKTVALSSVEAAAFSAVFGQLLDWAVRRPDTDVDQMLRSQVVPIFDDLVQGKRSELVLTPMARQLTLTMWSWSDDEQLQPTARQLWPALDALLRSLLMATPPPAASVVTHAGLLLSVLMDPSFKETRSAPTRQPVVRAARIRFDDTAPSGDGVQTSVPEGAAAPEWLAESMVELCVELCSWSLECDQTETYTELLARLLRHGAVARRLLQSRNVSAGEMIERFVMQPQAQASLLFSLLDAVDDVPQRLRLLHDVVDADAAAGAALVAVALQQNLHRQTSVSEWLGTEQVRRLLADTAGLVAAGGHPDPAAAWNLIRASFNAKKADGSDELALPESHIDAVLTSLLQGLTSTGASDDDDDAAVGRVTSALHGVWTSAPRCLMSLDAADRFLDGALRTLCSEATATLPTPAVDDLMSVWRTGAAFDVGRRAAAAADRIRACLLTDVDARLLERLLLLLQHVIQLVQADGGSLTELTERLTPTADQWRRLAREDQAMHLMARPLMSASVYVADYAGPVRPVQLGHWAPLVKAALVVSELLLSLDAGRQHRPPAVVAHLLYAAAAARLLLGLFSKRPQDEALKTMASLSSRLDANVDAVLTACSADDQLQVFGAALAASQRTGGWIWSSVTRRLRSAGHSVDTQTTDDFQQTPAALDEGAVQRNAAARLLMAQLAEEGRCWTQCRPTLTSLRLLLERLHGEAEPETLDAVAATLALTQRWQKENSQRFLFGVDLKALVLDTGEAGTALTVVEVVRLLAAVAELQPPQLPHHQWDAMLCSMTSWCSTLEESWNDWGPNHVFSSVHLAFTVALCRLVRTCGRLVADVEHGRRDASNLPPDLVSEWHDVFSEAAFSAVLPVFLRLAMRWNKINAVALDCVIEGLVAALENLPRRHLHHTMDELTPLLLAKHPAIQLGAYGLILKLLSDVAATELSLIAKEDSDSDKAPERAPPPALLRLLQDTRPHHVDEVRVGDAAPAVEAHGVEGVNLVAHLLSWKLTLALCGCAGSELRYQYAAHLTESGLMSQLIDDLFRIIPHAVQQHLVDLDQELDTQAPIDWLALQQLATQVYASALRHLPAVIRRCLNNADKRTACLVEKFTARCVSPVLCSSHLQHVTSSWENMTVRVRLTAREAIATYKLNEEASMELVVQLPANYPLGNITVEGGRKVGVTTGQWRTWMLQLTTFLTHQNGSILDGLTLWKRNVDKRFEGIEECYICYYVLHGSNYQLPKLTCRTCRKKFHAACLYKWFSTSNNSTCPLCRNLF